MASYLYGGLAQSTGGVVASEHPLATIAGVRVLEEGGNAVDAAVAVSLVLAVVQPHLGGLGGDFFALAGPGPVFVDGSGPAPGAASIGAVRGRGHGSMPRRGPLTITVPGMVDALYRMWSQLGSLPWHRLVEPAARIAREGFPVHRELVRALEANRGLLASGLGSGFYLEAAGPDGIARFPGLALALERIASDPRDFYEGEIARAIAGHVQAVGGLLSQEDLASYRARLGTPIEAEAYGFRLYETPPPTQGATSLLLARLLEQASWGSPLGRARARALLAASRLAYRVRDSYIIDPDHMEVDPGALIDPGEAARLAGALKGAPGGDGDTTYFIVVDGEGRWVSGIQSLYNHFGSGVAEPRFQIPLNNRGADFSLDPRHPNRLEPGKRTRHTLSTMAAVRGGETILLGTSGGNYRPQIHALLLTNKTVHGMSLEEAVNLPRLLWDPYTGRVRFEEGWDWYGTPLPYPSRLGVAAMARIRGRLAEAYEDPRGTGIAAPAL